MTGTKRGALSAGAVLGFGECSSSGAASPPSDPLGVVTIGSGEAIHIADWGVLSGADASLGQDALYGVQIAVDDRGGVGDVGLGCSCADGQLRGESDDLADRELNRFEFVFAEAVLCNGDRVVSSRNQRTHGENAGAAGYNFAVNAFGLVVDCDLRTGNH